MNRESKAALLALWLFLNFVATCALTVCFVLAIAGHAQPEATFMLMLAALFFGANTWALTEEGP